MKYVTLSILAASLFIHNTAGAAEGEILIDQARALQGHITPNDTPGFPITISQEGHYKLTGPLKVPAGQGGIFVFTDNVTLDLNGFEIATADKATPDTYGVITPFTVAGQWGRMFSNMSIRNGTIRGFRIGIGIGDSARIENMRLLNNDLNAVIDNGSIVRNITSGGQIECQGDCIIDSNIVRGGGVRAGNGNIVNNTITVREGESAIGGSHAAWYYGTVGYGNNTIFNEKGKDVQIIGGGSGYVHIGELNPNYCGYRGCPSSSTAAPSSK